MINIIVSPTEIIDNPYDKIEKPINRYDIDNRVDAIVSVPDIVVGNIEQFAENIDGTL